MRVAVVGGGLFGITCAIKVTRTIDESAVDLFEKSDDILTAASNTNLWRLHRGYHYPRSEATAKECKKSEPQFKQEYGEAILDDFDHYYCIAQQRSKTRPEEFVAHCNRLGLEYSRVDLDVVNDETVGLSVGIEESLIDPNGLRETCQKKLAETGIRVRTGREIYSLDELAAYDFVIVACYANNNQLLSDHPSLCRNYKFQLVEVPIIELPATFENRSILVLDGPFLGVDPYGRSDRHQLYHVVHSIHDTCYGETPTFDDRFERVLNTGCIENVPESNYSSMVKDGSRFLKGLEDAEYIGSKFTIRTVLPEVEDTDTRPTLVDRSANVFSVFSGKIGTCVTAAENIVNEIASSG